MKTTDRRADSFVSGKIFWPSAGIRRHMVSHGIKDGVVAECLRFCFEIDVLICWTNGSMKRQYIFVYISVRRRYIKACACFGTKDPAIGGCTQNGFYYYFSDVFFFFCSAIFSELHCRRPFSIHRRLVVSRAQNGNSAIVRFMAGKCRRWMHRTSIGVH